MHALHSLESLKKHASGLSGAPSPGDSREVARLIAQLCEHVSSLAEKVSELRGQIHKEAQQEMGQIPEDTMGNTDPRQDDEGQPSGGQQK